MKRLYVLLFISFCCVILSYAQDAYFVSDNIAKDKNKSADAIPWHQKDKGWWCALEIHGGSVWYRPNAYEGMLGFTVINGYRFSQFAKLGIGIGFNGILYDYQLVSEFPYKLLGITPRLLLNARGNIMRQDSRRCVPFWNVDVGYDLFQLVCYFDAGVGVRVALTKKNFNRHAFVLSANYIGRMVDDMYRGQSYISERDGNMYKVGNFSNGILFKVGYEF